MFVSARVDPDVTVVLDGCEPCTLRILHGRYRNQESLAQTRTLRTRILNQGFFLSQ